MDPFILAQTSVSVDYYQYQMGMVFIVVAGVVTLLGILLGVLNSMHKTRHTEQSRREIAAYIAEGSMSPEDGERLLEAGANKPWNWGCGWGNPGPDKKKS